jgi:hypothetical protein
MGDYQCLLSLADFDNENLRVCDSNERGRRARQERGSVVRIVNKTPGKGNIASCDLKIIAISITLWKFPIKIAPVPSHFPEILALKIFNPAQVFFFSTIFFLRKTLHLHSKTVHFTIVRSNLTFSAPHLTVIISLKIVDWCQVLLYNAVVSMLLH